ncbi:MAG: MdtA/MuxA family multidrug efflux RND transporter periplasmic adaptor subunit [Burkholderiales bacterium]|nr:MdtA/MuxA family multidrug efflux RND transporter periplasmic adaptor subunit [Burkholderiales bacterium]
MNRPVETPVEESAVARAGARRRWLWTALAAALLVLAAYFAYHRFGGAPSPEPPHGAGRFGGPAGAGGPTPVVAVPARTGSIDVYLNGLGTVTPDRTVTVRSRVDGQLLRVLFQEGQAVKPGELLAEIDPRPFEVQLAQAEGQLLRDRALLDNARLDLARYQKLFAEDSIAKQQVDTQAALVRQYEGTVKIDQSQIDNARLQITYSRVTAPVGGRVGLRLVDPGNIVHASDANGIVIITQLQPVSVVFTIPQDNVPAVMKRVRAGDALPVEALNREQTVRLAEGTLASVDNLIDPTTGTVKLKARFANEDSALFPNQFVNVRMRIDTLHDATLIPSSAVQRGAQGMYVYVVKDDHTVTVRPVKIGPSDGPRIAVTEGLAPGEQVVIDGVDRLREGAAVEVSERRPELNAPPEGRAAKGAQRGPRSGAPSGAGAARGGAGKAQR